jgi:hypothetical protein
VPSDPLTRAEGFRYLSRLTKLALEQYVEASDPDFPFFYKLSHETAKIGADNPDNVYWNAAIKGTNDYRITGKRGSMFYFSIVANAMRYHIDGSAHATGQLLDSDIHWGPDGELEIIASCTPQPGKNWLVLEPDASVIVLRQSALDRTAERQQALRPRPISSAASHQPLPTGRGCFANTPISSSRLIKRCFKRAAGQRISFMPMRIGKSRRTKRC